MFQRIKAKVINTLSEKLQIPSLSNDIQSEMRYRQADFRDLTLELGALKDKLNALHATLTPVVLFKGSLFHGGLNFCEYAFAARAEKTERGYIINVQPDCRVSIKTIRILSGVCDIVECRMANMDMLSGLKASFPYDGGEITIDDKEGFEISPANRIYMRLQPRDMT